ncbi:MAG: T9SS type A sorting domain-containing protein [Flavobacteriales bacterium]|nr:T9SS type A sorting domain-containing protein [Flavobacteriales bacterium]
MRISQLFALFLFAPSALSAQFDYDARILDYKGLKFPCEGTVTPKLLIRNEGTVAMSGCVVETWKNGVIVNTFDWQLAIPAAPNESRQPVFPDVPDVEPGDELEFRIKTVNEIPDENADGNEKTIELSDPFAATTANSVEVIVTTDDAPEDLTWEIRDAGGAVMASGGPYEEANTEINETVVLGTSACYAFKGSDSGRDVSSTAGMRVQANGNTLFVYSASELTAGSTKGIGTGEGGGCDHPLSLVVRTDEQPLETNWSIIEASSGATVCAGNGALPASSVVAEECCLPDGCYRLIVTDLGGDGILSGGYVLRAMNGNERIIDNTDNFSNGSVSAVSNDQTFCLPIGTDKLIYSSCDKLDWVANKFIVASANPAVSAQFGVTNTTSGYEFWFFDPNGSYSYRRFRSHATSDGFGTGATRGCHFKVNGWVNSVSTPHLPNNVLLNVRVRGRVAGNNLEFGPACQFKLDAALAACPRVSLQDDPANTSDFSCGVFRNFGGASNPNNRITATPPQPIPAVASSAVRYQFRFRIPGENICIVRPPQTSARLVLNWTTGTPLQCSRTYEVDVRVSLNGGATWCFGPAVADQASACADTEAWGKVCNVTINPCAAVNGGGNNMVIEGNNTFTMYPNPNRGDQLFLSVSNVEEGVSTVNLDIFDMAGKRVMARTIAVQDGFINSALELNNELSNGMYLVNMTAGKRAYTQRLMIQR